MSEETRLGVGPHSAAMVRALGLLYIAGPSVAVVCQLLPHPPRTNETAIWVMAAIAYSMVPVIFTQYRRLPPGAISGLVALANSLVTAVVYFDHEATSYYAYFYLWVTPYAAIFFSTRHAAAHLAYPAVAYALVLAVHDRDGQGAPGGSEAGHWLHVISVLAVTMLLVRALARALRDEMAAIEAERRRRAMEINDDVVQQLVIARQRYADGDRDRGDASVDVALDRARRIMAEMIEPAGATPGSLRRDRPANAGEG